MLKVLSTKLLDQSQIDIAHEMDIALTCVDFIRTHYLDFEMPVAQYDTIVFTSSNAVKSFFEKENASALKSSIEDLGVKVFAISGKTKTELAKHNIEPITVADNAEKLADVVIAHSNIKSVLHICGDLKLDTLGNKLVESDIAYTPLVVYETTLSGTKLKEDYDAVMFYSPSGVESFVRENKIDPDVLYCCIGETTADKLRNIDSRGNVVVSKEPSPEVMLSTIQHFKIKY